MLASEVSRLLAPEVDPRRRCQLKWIQISKISVFNQRFEISALKSAVWIRNSFRQGRINSDGVSLIDSLVCFCFIPSFDPLPIFSLSQSILNYFRPDDIIREGVSLIGLLARLCFASSFPPLSLIFSQLFCTSIVFPEYNSSCLTPVLYSQNAIAVV